MSSDSAVETNAMEYQVTNIHLSAGMGGEGRYCRKDGEETLAEMKREMKERTQQGVYDPIKLQTACMREMKEFSVASQPTNQYLRLTSSPNDLCHLFPFHISPPSPVPCSLPANQTTP